MYTNSVLPDVLLGSYPVNLCASKPLFLYLKITNTAKLWKCCGLPDLAFKWHHLRVRCCMLCGGMTLRTAVGSNGMSMSILWVYWSQQGARVVKSIPRGLDSCLCCFLLCDFGKFLTCFFFFFSSIQWL